MREFIKNIKLENFKAYSDLNNGQGINLNVPKAGKPGSGLTILVGENNSGKSTILSAISKLKDDSRFHEVEKNNPSREIKITLTTTSGITILQSTESNTLVDRQGTLNYRDVEIVKDSRIWISKFDYDSLDHQSYKMNSILPRLEIDNALAPRLANLRRSENSEQLKKFDSFFKRVIPDFESWGISSHSPGSGDAIAYKAGGRTIEINTSLGSGLLNLFRIILSLVSDDTILFIDEPEAFLHPLAQMNLERLILEASKKRQIIFTTHSPYMFSNSLGTSKLIYGFVKKDAEVTIKKMTGDAAPVINSWNFISWRFFGVNSIGLHTELYEKLFASSGSSGVARFNDWLDVNTSKKKRNRSSDTSKHNYGNAHWPTDESLPVWIRNYYHHPELNKHGTKASQLGYYRKKPSLNEINTSIKFMMSQLNT